MSIIWFYQEHNQTGTRKRSCLIECFITLIGATIQLQLKKKLKRQETKKILTTETIYRIFGSIIIPKVKNSAIHIFLYMSMNKI